jgi:hypothetical protein
LGAALIAWWNADRSDLITESGGAMSSWRDVVAAYDMTAAGGEQPTYSATSFGGNPGATFNGTANVMTLGSVPFPTGATACNMWATADQQALAADATARHIFAYGGDSNLNQRRLYRNVTTGQNRVFVMVGNGATAPTANIAADFSGRHAARANVTGSQILAGMDGAQGGSTSVTPNTTSTRSRIGASANVAAAGFWQGVIRDVLVTTTLTAGQITQMNTWLASRL